jgi:hypothetical protein
LVPDNSLGMAYLPGRDVEINEAARYACARPTIVVRFDLT